MFFDRPIKLIKPNFFITVSGFRALA